MSAKFVASDLVNCNKKEAVNSHESRARETPKVRLVNMVSHLFCQKIVWCEMSVVWVN